MRASTVNGSIEATYRAMDGTNRFSTTNGSVRLRIPSRVDATLEARTVNGRIRSDFEELESDESRWRRRRLSGRIGSGMGGSFEITTVNGSVAVRKNGSRLTSTSPSM